MTAANKRSSQLARRMALLQISRAPTMDLTGETSSVTPAKAAFGSVSTLLTMIGVRLPLFCNGLLLAHT